MKKKLLISFSGGRTSAFMTHWLLANMQNEFEMLVVFANTGKEREETLEFIQQCDRHFGFNLVWIESVTNYQKGKGVSARVISFENASRDGEPFESFIKKHGIPNIGAPKCSRELKADAIRAYARSIGWKRYTTAIGIRQDEPKRVNWEAAGRQRIIYPLVTMVPCTKNDINSFWMKQPFDLRLKSYEGNCDLCWKKSKRKLMTIVSENPHLAGWWADMESQYGNFIPGGSAGNPNIRLPVKFYRENLSITDIQTASLLPFKMAEDESQSVESCRQLQLFNIRIDIEDAGCSNSCEGF